MTGTMQITTEQDRVVATEIAELELLGDIVKPSGGEDGTRYEIYASRCPSQPGF